MDQAVAGLLGALVGGTLTAGSSLLVEWQRLRSSKSERDEAAATQYRQAGRLVGEELFEATFRIEMALESFEWWPPEVTLPTDRWERYAPVLALGDEPAWGSVEVAYGVIRDINGLVARHRSLDQAPPWTQDTSRELIIAGRAIRDGIDSVRTAIGLDPLSGDGFVSDDRYKHLSAGQLTFRGSPGF